MANREVEALRKTVQAAKKVVARPPLDQANDEPTVTQRQDNGPARTS